MGGGRTRRFDAAKGQWLVVDAPNTVAFTTDPVALDGLDRLTAVLVVHKIFGGTTVNDRQLVWTPQTSNDAVNWVPGSPVDVNETSDTPKQTVALHRGAWLRFHFYFEVTVGTGPGGVLFDLDVLLDKK